MRKFICTLSALALLLFFTRSAIAAETGIGVTGGGGEGFVTSGASGDLYFGANGERVRITSAGNVGIATTDPDGLQINLAVSETARGVSNVRAGISGSPRLILEDNGVAQWEIDNFSGVLRFFQPGSVKLNITTEGYLYTNNWTDVAFGTGWSNYAGGYQNVQYKKIGDLVFLRGLANSGANAWSTYPVIFTLPAGFRPQMKLIGFDPTGNANVSVRVAVENAGTVRWEAGGAGTGWISMDGICFSVD